MLLYLLYFFFFKQKTAYEVRISYWSSDVCSSDLGERGSRIGDGRRAALVEEQAFARAAAVEQHMVERDAGEFHPRRDLVADGVARLHAIFARDDRRTAARRFVAADPEAGAPRRGHGRRRGAPTLAPEEGTQAGV